MIVLCFESAFVVAITQVNRKQSSVMLEGKKITRIVWGAEPDSIRVEATGCGAAAW